MMSVVEINVYHSLQLLVFGPGPNPVKKLRLGLLHSVFRHCVRLFQVTRPFLTYLNSGV